MHVKDLSLAPQGQTKITWNEIDMPVLLAIRKRFEREQPFKGLRMAACLHVTAKTAALVRTLKAGGADIVLCASNPLSTQDDVAAALVVGDEIPVFAVKGEDTATYYQHLNAALDHRPHITLDDGCDLVSMLHKERAEQVAEVLCGTEETTTGVQRLRAMAKDKALRYPVLAVNDSVTKHHFDNRYGTGQSALDGVIRATNLLIAGRTVVVVGYGWCGRGVASRAHGLGAQVVVTEVDEMRALEAVMDGFRVLPLARAVREADLVLTVTGNKHVVSERHFKVMKDGAILANAGHFNVEIDLPALRGLCAEDPREVRPLVEQYVLSDGRRIHVLAGGRLVNLAAGEGHPPAIMDMSFANQALGAEYMLKNHAKLRAGVYTIPESIDRDIARLKLSTLGVQIDRLTAEQRKYLASWEEGT
ncbi:MAG: adenosylhomocysteinase [Chloroflexota bacterium]|jgi:adenosylhomocysteinase